MQFYRDDLADGYVRVAEELAQASHHDQEIARRRRAIELRWQALLAQAAADELPGLGIHVPAEYVASVVASFWRGMNTRIVEGRSEADGRFFEILEFVGDWLEAREQSS